MKWRSVSGRRLTERWDDVRVDIDFTCDRCGQRESGLLDIGLPGQDRRPDGWTYVLDPRCLDTPLWRKPEPDNKTPSRFLDLCFPCLQFLIDAVLEADKLWKERIQRAFRLQTDHKARQEARKKAAEDALADTSAVELT